MNYIEQYHQAILKGEIVVGKKIRRQYDKLVRDIYNPYTVQLLQPDGTYKKVTYIFDEDKANRPINFIETFCKQSKAPFAGQPLKLILWQKALIQSIYGFVDSENGYRRYREVLVEVARKNGKSTLLSGLASYHLICEKGIQVVTAANTKSQAAIIFDEAKNMIMQSPALSKRAKKRKYDLFVPSLFNSMQPLASDSSNLDGLNADLVELDEIHEFTDTAMYDIVKQSQGTKLEPLLFMITTNGFVRDNFLDNKLDYADNVLNDIYDDHTFLGIIYEVDDKKDVEDYKNWIKANPSLSEFRSFTELNQLVNQAQNDKSIQATLYAKYFNIPQVANTAWLKYEELINTETFEMKEFTNNYFVGGFDLSEVGDLTCGTMLFMRAGSDKKYIEQMYWIPKNLVEKKEKEDKVPYSQWIECRLMRTSGESKIDTDDVINWFLEMCEKYHLYPQWQGYDRWGAAEFRKKMKEDYGIEMIDVVQGFKTFSNPMKNLKADFIDKKIIYNNNPILKWCIANTVELRDNNDNVRPIKGKNKSKRIDGMVSLLDAYVVLMDKYSEFTNLL